MPILLPWIIPDITTGDPAKKECSVRMITFDKIEFGLARIGSICLIADEDSPTGHIFLADDFKVIESTAEIEARIGVIFGIRYRVRTTSSEKFVYFEERIDHPTMTHPETGEKISHSLETIVQNKNHWGCGFFNFEYDWELVKGEWVFSYSTLEGDLIHRQKFDLH